MASRRRAGRLEPLERDVYDTLDWYSDGAATDSDEGDDAVQAQMRSIAGLPPATGKRAAAVRPAHQPCDDFEADAEGELQDAFAAHTNSLLGRGGDAPASSTAAQSDGSSTKAKPKPVAKRVSFQPTEQAAGKSAKRPAASTEADQVASDPALALNEKKTDSDDEFERGEQLARPSDDELLYDRDEDVANERWARSQRPERAERSDAVLNCPMCMTLLCLDCQRHSLYKTQYRAMFVHNCAISTSELLHVPADTKAKRRNAKRNKQKRLEGAESSTLEQNFIGGERMDAGDAKLQGDTAPSANDLFKPVACAHCKTEVAVLDCDEVYHFFNVLASYT